MKMSGRSGPPLPSAPGPAPATASETAPVVLAVIKAKDWVANKQIKIPFLKVYSSAAEFSV